MTINMNNLPSKFYPYLLGHEKCSASFKNEIDTVFEKPLKAIKDNYVFDAGKWVLKLGRPVLLTTPDTHLYRIRKAEKIRQYIINNGLQHALMVPQKFLYWNAGESQFYIVSEKVVLAWEVPTPSSNDLKIRLFHNFHKIGGQVQAFAEGASKRELTPEQAKALAELSWQVGYTDLSYNNLYFTPEGKIAIIDTEPVKRAIRKRFTYKKLWGWLGDKNSLIAQQALSGTAKLKLYCDPSLALKEIEQVEKKHVLWTMTKLISKIAILGVFIYYTPLMLAYLPLGAGVLKILKVTLLMLAIVKEIILTCSLLAVASVWENSHQGMLGIAQIEAYETKGLF